MEDRLKHPSFRELVQLGNDAVPLMMKQLADDQDNLPWEFVLQEITGIRFLSDDGQYDFDNARRKRLEWWNKRQEMSKSLAQALLLP